jgi:hypothetical protein
MYERTLYPLQLSEPWTKEYEAIKTASERIDWVAQKVEECKVIKAVRATKRFENKANTFAPAC